MRVGIRLGWVAYIGEQMAHRAASATPMVTPRKAPRMRLRWHHGL
jgi:hypothetical protein